MRRGSNSGADDKRDSNMLQLIETRTDGKGLYEITPSVQAIVSACGHDQGLCTLFIQHTSASLVVQENADPSVAHDLQAWLERLVPENDGAFTHTAEGPDDMPSHIKSALTSTSLSIPFASRRLVLGTWQGIFIWEHRRRGSLRRCAVHVA